MRNASAYLYIFLIWGFPWLTALLGIDKLISQLELSSIINMGLIGLALSVFRGESIARDQPHTAKHPRYRIKVVVQKI